jgi:hypothetical protein
MSLSLFNVRTEGKPRGVNVLAADSAAGSAVENAMAAGVASSDVFQGASQVGNAPISATIPAAVAPATDGAPKAVYMVSFQTATGANGGTPQPMLVLAWPQRGEGSAARAEVLAARTAAATANAVVAQVMLLGTVEIDATGAPAVAAQLSKFAFRSLFTLVELVGIDNYASSATLTTAQKGVITTILANFAAAEDISLSDPATEAGVNYLASAGLLTTARAEQILSGTSALAVTAPTIAATDGTAIAPIDAVATGGSGSGYAFSATGLPAGLSMTSAGQISGTPTAAGSYSYTVNVTDSAGDTAAAAGSITVI